MNRVLSLRSSLNAGGCSFEARITADYGDAIHQFSMACTFDPGGTLRFRVLSPETIADITGEVSAGGGKLTFDDTLLAFELLADGQFSPVSGPWVIMQALVGGYITSCGMDDGKLRATIRDTYAEDALTADIWMDENNYPVYGEIYWDNRRILTMEIINFALV